MKPKLLVVDDEPEILEMVRDHFEPRGFEVRAAGDGGEAIRISREFLPDVILLDLKMRGLDGDQAIPGLREASPESKIFLITAYQDPSQANRLESLGADAAFEKPVSILALEQEIRKVLG